MPSVVKPRKLGIEEPHEAIHKIRITLSSKSIKNLEQVCVDLVHVAKEKMLKMKDLSECLPRCFTLQLTSLLVVKEQIFLASLSSECIKE